MYLGTLLKLWEREPCFKKVIAGIAGESGFHGLISGLEGSQRDFMIAAIFEHVSKTVLIVTADSLRAEKVAENLLAFLPEDRVALLPARELLFNEDMLTQSREISEGRLKVMTLLASGKKAAVVAPVSALNYRVMPYDRWRELSLSIRRGQVFEHRQLLQRFMDLGYERAPLIETKGQFSIRGGILDVFPPGDENPVRIEFFDDTVDSIRSFDFITQRSISDVDEVKVLPAGEILLDEKIRANGLDAIRKELSRVSSRLQSRGRKEMAERLQEKVNRHLAKLDQTELREGLYGYFPFFYQGSSWLDYLPGDSLVIMEEPARIREAAEIHAREWYDMQSNLLLQGEALSAGSDLILRYDDLFSYLKHPCLKFSLFHMTGIKTPSANNYTVEAKDAPFFHGQWDLFESELKDWEKEGFRIFLTASTEEQCDALHAHLKYLDIPTARKIVCQKSTISQYGSPAIIRGSLNSGFIIPSLKIILVTEYDILQRQKHQKKRRIGGNPDSKRLRHYSDLQVGDLVVHENHGIGKYLGVQTMEVNGVMRDYLHVRYAGNDKLFIPTDQIELIQKYIGTEGSSPRLNRLGGGEWSRIKNRVKQSIQELAQELLSIYSIRQAIKGHAFSKHAWQGEFNSYFPYEETPDQLQSIAEVSGDLETERPMDRLLCGDVGYGKTEVAMRAAFKVVMEGKQVAFMVPTTILAHQHYRTFLERFSAFPVKITQLSRFLNQAQQKEAVQNIARGTVDIVIGTHRLLSGDIRFKDLGLFIIDEEHRFGVRQKEKLKKMRLNVDVLTLTATPIPRTMHMSLVGARDLSVIETPPENRYPVQTYVVEYSDQLAREAIVRELRRGGQVFFVYNRVQHIEKWAKKLQELVPDARIAVGHGQMPETRLERVMSDFLDGRYDILLSTTIIEAGLDIPNVNTIIIYDADSFGLAQLYQLRGRVGRSTRLAYAYLTYRRDKVLTEVAEKRLQAIKEFAELGSGFKIALRDLEIRGAGNILGPEQHGFMSALGFELYCRLLEEEINNIKGERSREKKDPRIDIRVNAYLPASYITEQEQKIDFYHRLYAVLSLDELDEIRKELRDRFGPIPREAENLVLVNRIRILSRDLNIQSINQQAKEVIINFDPGQKLDSSAIRRLASRYAGRMSISVGKKISMKFSENSELLLKSMVEVLSELKELTESISDEQKYKNA